MAQNIHIHLPSLLKKPVKARDAAPTVKRKFSSLQDWRSQVYKRYKRVSFYYNNSTQMNEAYPKDSGLSGTTLHYDEKTGIGEIHEGTPAKDAVSPNEILREVRELENEIRRMPAARWEEAKKKEARMTQLWSQAKSEGLPAPSISAITATLGAVGKLISKMRQTHQNQPAATHRGNPMFLDEESPEQIKNKILQLEARMDRFSSSAPLRMKAEVANQIKELKARLAKMEGTKDAGIARGDIVKVQGKSGEYRVSVVGELIVLKTLGGGDAGTAKPENVTFVRKGSSERSMVPTGKVYLAKDADSSPAWTEFRRETWEKLEVGKTYKIAGRSGTVMKKSENPGSGNRTGGGNPMALIKWKDASNVEIGKPNQVGDFTIKVGNQTFNCSFDGKYYRSGMMRASSAQALADLIIKKAKDAGGVEYLTSNDILEMYGPTFLSKVQRMKEATAPDGSTIKVDARGFTRTGF